MDTLKMTRVQCLLGPRTAEHQVEQTHLIVGHVWVLVISQREQFYAAQMLHENILSSVLERSNLKYLWNWLQHTYVQPRQGVLITEKKKMQRKKILAFALFPWQSFEVNDEMLKCKRSGNQIRIFHMLKRFDPIALENIRNLLTIY